MRKGNFTIADTLSIGTQVALQIAAEAYQPQREIDLAVHKAKAILFKDLAKKRAAERFAQRERDRLAKIEYERAAGHAPNGKIIRPVKG